MPLPTLADLPANLHGKVVLLRADVDVPVSGDEVTDDTRLRAFAPTVVHLRKEGARVVILGHRGRPKGERIFDLSLGPVARHLQGVLGTEVRFAKDCVGAAAKEAIELLHPGDVLLLENLRFHAGEEKNDGRFAEALAELGDIYINDAFATAHRAHASTSALPRLMAHKGAGTVLAGEVAALNKVVGQPERPLVLVIGGAKISSKIGVLQHFIGKADTLIIGGAMANTFLAAAGYKMGRSLFETEQVEAARAVLTEAGVAGCRILLPQDAVVAHKLEEGAGCRTCPLEDLHGDEMVLDVGPTTLKVWKKILTSAKTILWNGPAGAFEVPPFHTGTVGLAKAIAESPAFSVVGGGDTLAAIAKAGTGGKYGYTSTAGGALLEFMEGKPLPALLALEAGREKAAGAA